MDFGFDRLIQVWKLTLFVEAFSIIMVLYLLLQIVAIPGKTYPKKIGILYFFSVCLLFISTAIINLLVDDLYLAIKYVEIFNMWFNCIEVYVFFKLFIVTKALAGSNHARLLAQSLIITFLSISILFFFINVENNSKHYRPILKAGEIIDVLKRCLICIPCLLYFLKIFKSNSALKMDEVMVVFSVFCYSVLGIISYSLAANISEYIVLKRIVVTLPALSLLFLCWCLYSYIKSNNESIYKKQNYIIS
jgi:hypothetical protein